MFLYKMKGNKLSKQEPLNKGSGVPFCKFKRERQTLNRNHFHFKRISTWEQMFHTLVKRNNYCKKEPINRNNCSSNYERELAAVPKMTIWELFVPLTKSKLEQSVLILAENEHFVPTYIKYVPL